MKQQSSNQANGWNKVGNLGEMHDGRGNSLVYGEFGFDTYGLYTTVDGAEHIICIRAESPAAAMRDANEILDKLSHGWRPVNW